MMMSMKEEIEVESPTVPNDWTFTEKEIDDFLNSVPDRKVEEEKRFEICSFIRQLGIDVRV